MKSDTLIYMNHAWTALLIVVVGIGGWYVGSRHSPVGTGADTSGPIFSVATSSGETYFIVGADGKVGVNTPSPVTTLDVFGSIRVLETATTTCDGGRAGTILYNAGNQKFWGCNGTEWHRLDE
jgi:hypothetical protein